MNILRRKKAPRHQHGFTLIELIVAMAFSAIVIADIYTTYKSQQDSYVDQEQVAEMQQNLRAAIYMMARDVRMAGFNPADSTDVEGFVTELPDDPGPVTATNATHIAFIIDRDEDGVVDTDDHEEQIAYRFDNVNFRLEKFMYNASTNMWQWETISENIDALDFVYRDQNGNPIALPLTVITMQDIRSVDITIVARTGRTDPDFTDTQAYLNQEDVQILAAQNDNRRRRLLTTNIACRNMGI